MAGSGLRVGDRQFSSNEVWSFVSGIILGQIVFGLLGGTLFVLAALLSRAALGSLVTSAAIAFIVVLCLAASAGLGVGAGRTKAVSWAAAAGVGAVSGLNAIRSLFQTSGDLGWAVGSAALFITLGVCLVGGYALGLRDARSRQEVAHVPVDAA